MLGNGKRVRREENEPGSSNTLPPERNPLRNSVVLTRLFEFCNLSDLLNCRLVSKEWYSLSLPLIRNNATVRISRLCNGHLHWTTFHENYQLVKEQYRVFELFDFEFLDGPPPSKVIESTDNNIFGQGPEEMQQIYKNMEQFWVQCGHFIRSLKLYQSRVHSIDVFKKAIFEDTPNLEELSLVDVVIVDGYGLRQDDGEEVVKVNLNLKYLKVDRSKRSSRTAFPISWSLLFDHFPNIQTFDLWNEIDAESAINAFVKMLESLEEIPLKVFKMCKRFKNQKQCTALQRLFELPNLKLTGLDLWGTYFEEVDGRSVVETALRRHGDTLESLFLTSCRDRPPDDDSLQPMINIPCRTEPLQALTLLELVMGVGFGWSNFHFLQQTPNLKTLRVYGAVRLPDEADFEIIGDTKLPFLEEFHFDSKCISEKAMKGFVKVLPNVERFSAFIDSGAFRIVCENWRKLTALSTTHCIHKHGRLPEVDYIGDEAITGIVDGVEERLPNITDLQCLTKLVILHTDKIGDSSIWNGFLKLPRLSDCCVFVSPTTSDEALAALLERFPEGGFIRTEPQRVSSRRVKRPPKRYRSN